MYAQLQEDTKGKLYNKKRREKSDSKHNINKNNSRNIVEHIMSVAVTVH